MRSNHDVHINYDALEDDILEKINDHIQSIEHSCLFFRTKAKIHKLNVLNAALDYLSGEMTKEAFEITLRDNPQYPDSVFFKKTLKLIEEVLDTEPFLYRNREGYMRFKPQKK